MEKTKNFDFNWEFGLFKIRTVHEDSEDINSPIRKICPIELVKYFDENHSSCNTIAYFTLDDEGYELRFVGNRTMQDIKPEEMAVIWEQLIEAQKKLNVFYEASGAY